MDSRQCACELLELSREFGPSQWAISAWVRQADRDEVAVTAA